MLGRGGGGGSAGPWGLGVTQGVCEPVFKKKPIINLVFEKHPAYSYTWFHRKLTYSYTVLLINIPFHVLCDL